MDHKGYMQQVTNGLLFLHFPQTQERYSRLVVSDWSGLFSGPLFGFTQNDAGKYLESLFPQEGRWLQAKVADYFHQKNFESNVFLSEVGLSFRITGYHNGFNSFVLMFARTNRFPESYEKPLTAKELGPVLTKISHAIRTPLNGVIGFAQYLKCRLEGSEEYFDMIIDNSYRLLRTVNNMICFFRLETDQVGTQPSECSLNKELDNIASEFFRHSNQALKDKILLKKSYGLKDGRDNVWIDPYLLQEILDKLLDNACKYTGEGEVELSYSIAGDAVIFQVKDDGPGLEQNKRGEIFQKFRQSGEYQAPECGGVGLGLAITQELVHILEGEIFLTSSPGEGSCFYFHLPYRNGSTNFWGNQKGCISRNWKVGLD